MPPSSSPAMRAAIAAIAPAGDAGEDALLVEQFLGPDDRVAVGDHDLAVEHREVDDRRDEAVVEGAQALDQLALHRLGGDDQRLRVGLLEAAAVAHQGAAGAEAADEGGDLVELVEDLDRGAVVVGQRIGLVAVLVGHVEAGLLGHLQRHLDGAVGALGPLRVDDLGPVHAQQLGPLLGDVVGHHDLAAGSPCAGRSSPGRCRCCRRSVRGSSGRVRSRPSASAASIIDLATRSLTEPVGLWPSSLA